MKEALNTWRYSIKRTTRLGSDLIEGQVNALDFRAALFEISSRYGWENPITDGNFFAMWQESDDAGIYEITGSKFAW